MAEWLGNGLQNRVQQFDSAWYLQTHIRLSWFAEPFLKFKTKMKTTFRITIAMIVMAFVFSFLIPNVTYAQKATFKNCRLETNVQDKNGKKKMVCHFSADFTGMKKHDAQIYMEVECPKGTTHEYLSNDYGGEGRLRYPVQKVKDFKNKNKTDKFVLNNKIIWMWNSDIHPKKGSHTYYVRLVAYDAQTYKVVGRSNYMTFKMTGK